MSNDNQHLQLSEPSQADGMESSTRKKKPAKDFRDSGWAWMIVLGCFIVNFLVVGTAVKSFGILYVEFQEKYGTSSGATVSIVALTQGLCLMLGPVSNMLAMKYTSRRVVMVGGILMFLGFILSMFPTQLIYIYFTYGVLIGVGASLAYSPSIVTVGQYFSRYRALANGLSVAGSGLGNFAVPPLIRHLVDHYGSVSSALMILGAITLNVCFAGSILRPPPISGSHGHSHGSKAPAKADPSAVKGAESTNHICSCCRTPSLLKLLDLTLFKNAVFLLYAFSVMLMFSGYPTLYVILPDQAKLLKIDKKHAAFLVSILGITDLIGRILFGFLADLNIIQKRFIFMGCTAMSGIAICIMPWMKGFIEFAVLGGITGLFAGGFFALIAVMLAEKLGVHRLHSAFGLVAMFMGLSFLFGAPISGLLKDYTGEWKSSFLFCGFMMLCGSGLLLLDPIAVKHEQKKLEVKAEVITASQVL